MDYNIRKNQLKQELKISEKARHELSGLLGVRVLQPSRGLPERRIRQMSWDLIISEVDSLINSQ